MNRIAFIITFVFAFGLIASNALAAEAMHKTLTKNNTLANFNELSPAEFFYGVSINHNNETMRHAQAYRTEKSESTQQAFNGLSPQNFFEFPGSEGLTATAPNEGIVCNRTIVPRTKMSSISNPAIFFGYTDINNEGGCSNC